MLGAMAGLFLLSGGVAQAQEGVNLDEVVLPRKTEIFIELQRGINSRTAQPGDRFSAVVEVPVTVDDSIVIPVGSYVLGHVVRKAPAGRVKGKAQLLLAFDTVILPDGVTRKMVAVLDSAEGYSTDSSREDGQLEAPGSQGEEVLIGAARGAATGVITGATVGIFRGQTLRGAGIGAAVGAAGGALLGLLEKGEEVELPRGSSLTIQLEESVGFVRPEPPPTGVRLTP
jgi:hypothetical protein